MIRRSLRRPMRSAVSVGFVPTKIGGITLWLRADLGVTTGATYTWADQSGTGDSNKNCSTVANQPSAPAADSSLGGQMSIKFSGVQILTSGSWASTLPKPYTIFCVGYSQSTSAGSKYAYDSLSGASQAGLFTNSGNGCVIVGGATLPGNGEILSKASIIGVYNDASSALYVSAHTATATGDTTTKTITGTTIGNTAGGGNFANWALGEIAVYNKALSSAEIDQLNTYASKRYGITIGA